MIKGLKPRGKQYKVADHGGLYLLVKPNGSKRWRLKYYIDGLDKRRSRSASVPRSH